MTYEHSHCWLEKDKLHENSPRKNVLATFAHSGLL